MLQIQFPDRMITYNTFMTDLANRIAERLTAISQQPAMISQREAYRQYGRCNVNRWRREGRLHPCKRPGRIEYPTCELRIAQQIQQDYLKC